MLVNGILPYERLRRNNFSGPFKPDERQFRDPFSTRVIQLPARLERFATRSEAGAPHTTPRQETVTRGDTVGTR